jgi:hypothetical protein
MNLHPRKSLDLDCTQEQFEAIHDRLEHTRSTSATVTVPKAALEALLRDHSRLIEKLERA